MTINGYYYDVTYEAGEGNTLMSAEKVANHLSTTSSPEEDLSNCDCGGAFLTAE